MIEWTDAQEKELQEAWTDIRVNHEIVLEYLAYLCATEPVRPPDTEFRAGKREGYYDILLSIRSKNDA